MKNFICFYLLEKLSRTITKSILNNQNSAIKYFLPLRYPSNKNAENKSGRELRINFTKAFIVYQIYSYKTMFSTI